MSRFKEVPPFQGYFCMLLRSRDHIHFYCPVLRMCSSGWFHCVHNQVYWFVPDSHCPTFFLLSSLQSFSDPAVPSIRLILEGSNAKKNNKCMCLFCQNKNLLGVYLPHLMTRLFCSSHCAVLHVPRYGYLKQHPRHCCGP